MVSLIQGERAVAFAGLVPEEQRMLTRAKEKLQASHHPYSKSEHCVAATVWIVLPSGQNRFHTSPNIEVRPRGGACAEDGAIYKTFGAEQQLHAKAICVIDQFGDGSSTSEVPYPCAASRGAIAELAAASGLCDEFRVIVSTTDLDRIVETKIGVLLPHAFDYP